mgnify:CR=1 FL=1|jgi:hypothetical protein
MVSIVARRYVGGQLQTYFEMASDITCPQPLDPDEELPQAVVAERIVRSARER